MSNITSANNLSVTNSATVGGTLLTSGLIQTTGNISAANVTATTNVNATNVNLTGKLNNLTLSNLNSLDTTSSLTSSLNTINSNISTIQANQTTDEANISTLQTQMSTVQSKQTTDETNIASLTNTKANDNAVVHLTGNETINGVKTFNNNINVNGNIKCSELYYGASNKTISQLDASLQNDIDLNVSNSTKITTLQNTVVSLQNQINTLTLYSIKAYGRWNSANNTLSINNGASSGTYGTYTVLGVNVTGVKIILNSSITNIQGIIQAVPDYGYTLSCRFEFLSVPFTFVVTSQGGGANPQVQNNSFFFIVI